MTLIKSRNIEAASIPKVCLVKVDLPEMFEVVGNGI